MRTRAEDNVNTKTTTTKIITDQKEFGEIVRETAAKALTRTKRSWLWQAVEVALAAITTSIHTCTRTHIHIYTSRQQYARDNKHSAGWLSTGLHALVYAAL